MTPKAVATGMLAASLVACSGEKGQPIAGELEKPPKIESGTAVEEVIGLREGSKITDVRVLTPQAGVEQDVLLRPVQHNQPEDLAVIIDPAHSERQQKLQGFPEGLSMGYLLMSHAGEVSYSGVLYNPETEEVALFSYARIFTEQTKLYLSTRTGLVALEPADDGGIRVIMDGVKPFTDVAEATTTPSVQA